MADGDGTRDDTDVTDDRRFFFFLMVIINLRASVTFACSVCHDVFQALLLFLCRDVLLFGLRK